jgi:cholesterol transport system auxiliary component
MSRSQKREQAGKWARLCAAALLAAPLGACALANVASEPAPRLFVLSAAHPDMAGGQAQGGQIVVDEFSAPAAIDTSRIVFQPAPNEIRYYADARWSDRAPRMIQSLTVETLENTGAFPAVSARGAGLEGDYALTGDIRRFAAAPGKGGGTEAHIGLLVRLVRANDRTIAASRLFEADAAATEGGMAGVVAAYDAALRRVLGDVARWIRDETAKAAVSSPAGR